MKHARLGGAIAALVPLASLVLFAPGAARAQGAPAAPVTVPAGPVTAPDPGSTYVPSMGYGNPQAANGTIGGGNATESSSHPVTGEEEDSFDFGSHGHGGGASHGDENGPVFGPRTPSMGGGMGAGPGGEVPMSHVVRRGDTLWGIGDYYFKNPYEWPRLWSFNPQIKNPNWIYPGDELKLKPPGAPETPGAGGKGGAGQNGFTLNDRRRHAPSDTVFLRDQGWIRDESDEVWGEVTGAAEDKMFLSDFDQVYLRIEDGHDVRIGQELTIFRPVHPSSATGAIVMIEGTARIDQWNARDRVARALVVETLNVIERGAKVGPLARSFEVVPPRRNETEVPARILASVHPNEFYGQNQVVFVNKGEAAGLKLGNRLFVVRRGDPWRQSLIQPIAGYRVSADDEKPMPAMEKTPGSTRDDRNYPDEVVAELRVVALKKDSATCLVTQSTVEIERGDFAVARSGY